MRRLLIANRSEIAVRIARTAHRLGIDTVGVHTPRDERALHVERVDASVAVGSYLDADALVRAARDAGCDAVHPGYGFLAENAGFARAVTEAGLVWVGPTADQIALLGDKVAAKRTAIDAGVPTVPLSDDVPAMPVLVKAAGGGGGRGMRIVRDEGELAGAMEEASREAESAFGDGTVFVEPYLERARHIEVQIVGDAHGNVIHLGERECSIQRRNQKVVEEAPSAGIDEATRTALWDGALALARAVGYQNAGTVEFLVAADGTVNLLEVNTRLQVEHPVTEAVTGLDLVELQLRVAAGEPLPIAQDDVVISGHAIEARLVAEDPAAGWLPAVGALASFEIRGPVRVDSGVREGSVVTTDYDSLLAKVIAHAPTRAEAARRLARSLRSARLAGPATNRDMLVATLSEPDFLRADTPTSYLADHPAVPAASGPEGDDRLALLLAAVAHVTEAHRAADRRWGFVRPGWRNLPTIGHRSTWLDGRGEAWFVEEQWHDHESATILVGSWPRPDADGALGPDERRRVALRLLGGGALEIDGVRRAATIVPGSGGVTTSGPAGSVTWRAQPRFVDHDAAEAGSGPVCPLPGTVIAVHVEAGQEVADGDLLMVVEAMKMEHKITATGAAVVAEVRFAVGDAVDVGDLLVALAHPEA